MTPSKWFSTISADTDLAKRKIMVHFLVRSVATGLAVWLAQIKKVLINERLKSTLGFCVPNSDDSIVQRILQYLLDKLKTHRVSLLGDKALTV